MDFTNITLWKSSLNRNDFVDTSYYIIRGCNVQEIFPYVLPEFPGFYFSLSLPVFDIQHGYIEY